MDNLQLEEVRALALKQVQPGRDERRRQEDQFDRETQAAQAAAERDLPKWILAIKAALTSGASFASNVDWDECEGSQMYVMALRQLLGDPFSVRNKLPGYFQKRSYSEVYWQ